MMSLPLKRLTLALSLVLAACAAAQNPATPTPPPYDPNGPSLWNGTWKLDVHRSSPAAAQPGVPQVYKFVLGPVTPDGTSTIRWEIPELGEIVDGRTDGIPMPVHRTEPTPGLTLLVRAANPFVLHYRVLKNGADTGGGTMMLVDNGHAWVDITWPTLDGKERQDLASELVYVRQ